MPNQYADPQPVTVLLEVIPSPGRSRRKIELDLIFNPDFWRRLDEQRPSHRDPRIKVLKVIPIQTVGATALIHRADLEATLAALAQNPPSDAPKAGRAGWFQALGAVKTALERGFPATPPAPSAVEPGGGGLDPNLSDDSGE